MGKYYKENYHLAMDLRHTRLFNVEIKAIWKALEDWEPESEDGRRCGGPVYIGQTVDHCQVVTTEVEVSPIIQRLNALEEETRDFIALHRNMALSYDPADLCVQTDIEPEMIQRLGNGDFEGNVTVVVRQDVHRRASQYVFGVHPSVNFQYVQPQSQGWTLSDEQKENRWDLAFEDMDDEQYAKYYPFMKAVEDILREEGHLDPDFELPEP